MSTKIYCMYWFVLINSITYTIAPYNSPRSVFEQHWDGSQIFIIMQKRR